ncbi:MAG: citrate/2-methylcitrate synthase [Vampirovibrionales bacterium]
MEATKACSATDYKPGLEGVIAGISSVSVIDTERDTLLYRGYDVRELSEHCVYEEVAYLLLYGELPTADQLAGFQQKIGSQRSLEQPIIDAMVSLPKGVNYMDALRTGVSLLGHWDTQAQQLDHDANVEKAIRLIAKIPTLITTVYRAQQGLPPTQPDPSLGHSANFFYMLNGQKPDALTVKTFDISMVLYAEHGYNASTFSAIVTCSSLSDMHSAITAAVATLKGSLHGGANEKAMVMLKEIGSADKAEAWVMDALAQKKKIMGFGHRVYKHGDTRAPILKELGRQLSEQKGDSTWHDLADVVEQVMMREKGLHTNVDFPAAYVYYMMGLPIDLYTPLFAASRVAGWAAHVIEQLDNNRLMRPKSGYNGPAYKPLKPLAERG